MGKYAATVHWSRGDAAFIDEKYSRAHEWRFDGGAVVSASASPQIVPPPHSVAANVDPEEAFVASLSSCHMLFFLSLAAAKGVVVDDYIDKAVGTMSRNAQGQIAMTNVELRPQACYAGNPPAGELLVSLHEEAHRRCFIANSVKTEVVIHPIS